MSEAIFLSSYKGKSWHQAEKNILSQLHLPSVGPTLSKDWVCPWLGNN
jgi:hypothetical protein